MDAKLDIRNILFLAEAFGKHRGLSQKTVSLYAARRGGYFDDLQSGRLGGRFGISDERRKKIVEWFSENWPKDLEWPAGIPRPPRKKADAA